MKTITKATSILLCICMLITILTVYVSAAEQQVAGSEKDLWSTGISDVVSNDHDCTEDSQFYDGEEFSDFLDVNEDVVLYENVVQIDDDAENFDTYLYVIDPRSTEFIVSGTDYNDDAGESLNAMLSRQLETNVPYFVIYSGYNLSNDNHTGDLTLDISRN